MAEAKDFAPVSLLTTGHFILVAHLSVPVKSVKDLIALAKTSPGKLNYASAGNGNATHLAGELLNTMANIKTVHVPYKGSGPAQIELRGGQVDFMFANITAVLGDVKAGRLKALAVTGPKRALAAPDIPTMSEAALPGYQITSWFGVMAPTGTPQEILSRLHGQLVRAIGLPDVRDRLLNLGSEPVGSTPEQFATHLRSEIQRLGKVMRQSKIFTK